MCIRGLQYAACSARTNMTSYIVYQSWKRLSGGPKFAPKTMLQTVIGLRKHNYIATHYRIVSICLTTLSLAGTQAMTSAEGTKRNTPEEHERNGCGNARCVLTKRRRMAVVRVGSATIQPSKERIRTRGARQRYSDGARATCCHRCEEAPAASVIHRGVGT